METGLIIGVLVSVTQKANNDIVISADSISKTYSSEKDIETEVIRQLSVKIKRTEFTAIMGPSGVGKSTLLHLLGSLDYPDKGSIKLHDNHSIYDYNEISPDKLAAIRNKLIGFVFQFSHLLPEFTALENVMIPNLIAGAGMSDAKKQALDLLKLVKVEHRANHRPKELSGGEQQRIAIARAIINKPAIVFADEPTGNLDSKNADSILKLIMTLIREYNITFVIATHSKDVAQMADRILIMGDGQIASDRRKDEKL